MKSLHLVTELSESVTLSSLHSLCVLKACKWMKILRASDGGLADGGLDPAADPAESRTVTGLHPEGHHSAASLK